VFQASPRGTVKGFEDGVAEVSHGAHREVDILGDSSFRHRNPGVAQGYRATEAIDQAQHVAGRTEHPYAASLGDTQHFQAIERGGAIGGADLFYD
jgi:hypothetical protein